MYTIAVCDDEKAVTERVKKLILEWNPQIQVACCLSGEELLENYHPCAAVFLDIDMKGVNGIEAGRQLRLIDRETKIVYLTAYRDYVAGAFEVHAFQYLLKPVNKKKLWNVLEEIFRYLSKPEKKTVLDFRTVNGLVCLDTEEIYYFEYISRRVRIVTDKEEYYMVDRISDVLERMKEFGFSMPHQSFVVNMAHVKNIRNQQIYLDNGEELPLSQKKQRAWKGELTNYLSERLERQRRV
ncbi:MAG: LytTR family DNA-binding domain-containing protein [Eubacteriales bacterium]|nr:LytTR family DNA-binding domain-containing protein [Eubacteriales bacterium]